MPLSGAVDILLVEDSFRDAEMAVRALRRARLTNPIHLVADGQEALDFLFREGAYRDRDHPVPRVVLLDLKLPKVNGLEVLAAIRGAEATRALPVVVLTSSREEPDIAQAYRLGANSYIVKPVDFEQFTKAVGDLGLYWCVLNAVPS